jgi:Predicted TIM-barrel enzyme, possibly a dioxygenase
MNIEPADICFLSIKRYNGLKTTKRGGLIREELQLGYTRKEVIQRLTGEVAKGRVLVGASAGTGFTAQILEESKVDLIAVYNGGKFQTAGNEMLAALLPFGDANEIVCSIGYEVMAAVKQTPVVAGVCGTDPFRVMEHYLKRLKEQGFSGVTNFPTVGLFDGQFRTNLEEAELGYESEVEMIRKARRLDLFTCPYVFHAKDAARMALAGADCLIIHCGLVTQGPIGRQKALSDSDCIRLLQEAGNTARAINPEIILLAQGGPLNETERLRNVLAASAEVNGYFEASRLERSAVELVIRNQVSSIKQSK